MQTLDIGLQKRSGKVFLYMVTVFFVGLWALQLTSYIIKGSHEWYNILLDIFLVIGVLSVAYSVFQYFTTKVMHMIVESDGSTMTFYNSTDQGKVSNKKDIADLSKMKRFYIVKTRTRYFMYNYSFAMEADGLLSNEKIEYPSLFESNDIDRAKVLEFVKTVAPHIELGYENIWQKLTKK